MKVVVWNICQGGQSSTSMAKFCYTPKTHYSISNRLRNISNQLRVLQPNITCLIDAWGFNKIDSQDLETLFPDYDVHIVSVGCPSLLDMMYCVLTLKRLNVTVEKKEITADRNMVIVSEPHPGLKVAFAYLEANDGYKRKVQLKALLWGCQSMSVDIVAGDFNTILDPNPWWDLRRIYTPKLYALSCLLPLIRGMYYPKLHNWTKILTQNTFGSPLFWKEHFPQDSFKDKFLRTVLSIILGEPFIQVDHVLHQSTEHFVKSVTVRNIGNLSDHCLIEFET